MNRESVFKLPAAEKLRLVEDLWDDLAAASPDALPLHEWQRQELDRRRDVHRVDPSSGASWEEVKGRIRDLSQRAERDISLCAVRAETARLDEDVPWMY